MADLCNHVYRPKKFTGNLSDHKLVKRTNVESDAMPFDNETFDRFWTRRASWKSRLLRYRYRRVSTNSRNLDATKVRNIKINIPVLFANIYENVSMSFTVDFATEIAAISSSAIFEFATRIISSRINVLFK